MVVLQRAYSTCEIIENQRVLKKYNNDPISLELFDNEVNWYKRFNRTPSVPPHTPKMFDYSNDTLVLEYVGNPITTDTIPVNFSNQLRKIASFLKYHNCHHCDIIPSNLLVLNTIVFIIDFGWAVEMGQNPYLKWKHVDKSIVDNIGGKFRTFNWPNDKSSFTKIYQKFSGNTYDKLFFHL